MLNNQSLLLRPLDPDDKLVTRAWRNDPETRDAMLGYRYPVTAAMEARWYRAVLEGQRKDEVHFALSFSGDARCLGLVSLRDVDCFARTAWVSILIGDKDNRKKGMGRAALALLKDYARMDLGLRKLSARIAAFNTPSQSLFQSGGFKQEARLREQVFAKGQLHDLLLYSIWL
jgi:RimJ/RimL family protein N-acetyltransferase